jgi:hypothetical protein
MCSAPLDSERKFDSSNVRLNLVFLRQKSFFSFLTGT